MRSSFLLSKLSVMRCLPGPVEMHETKKKMDVQDFRLVDTIVISHCIADTLIMVIQISWMCYLMSLTCKRCTTAVELKTAGMTPSPAFLEPD